jgi:hypothetical protein
MVPDEQLAAYLADELSPAGRAAVEAQLLADPAALQRLLAQRRVDTALRALLDPHACQIEVGIMTGVRGITDEAATERVLQDTVRSCRKPKSRWLWPTWQPAWNWAGAMALLLGMIVLGGWWRSAAAHHETNSALVVDITEARWLEHTPHLNVGDRLAAGPLELTAGVVQLKLANGVLVAVEGPARMMLTGQNFVELQTGRLSAEVPKAATGFAVKTRAATLVDLGTRFGVSVATNEPSEFHVFAGRVQVTAEKTGTPQALVAGRALAVAEDGTITSKQASPDDFPQLMRTKLVHPPNCGFESAKELGCGKCPTGYGLWNCIAGHRTGSQSGIKPQSERFMLQFEWPPATADGSRPPSEAWQLFDLRPIRKELGTGSLTVAWSAMFNRVVGDRASASVFGVAVAAFHGRPADAPKLWSQRRTAALALAEQDFTSDNQPATWESVKTTTTIPPEADFLVLELHAVAPENQVAGRNPFPGHFADSAVLEFTTPLLPSIPLADR